MEDGQKSRISSTFRQQELPSIQVLHIEDEYAYLDQDLIDMLTERINTIVTSEWE